MVLKVVVWTVDGATTFLHPLSNRIGRPRILGNLSKSYSTNDYRRIRLHLFDRLLRATEDPELNSAPHPPHQSYIVKLDLFIQSDNHRRLPKAQKLSSLSLPPNRLRVLVVLLSEGGQ